MGVVEDVHREVQDAVGGRGVLEDELIYGALVELGGEVPLGYETVIVKVALTCGPEVEEDQQAYAGGRNQPPVLAFGLVFSPDGPDYQQEGSCDEDEAGAGVLLEKHYPVGLEGIHEDVRLPGVSRRGEISGDAGEEHADQAETGRDGICREGVPEDLFLLEVSAHYLFEDQESKGREGPLEDDKGHGDRPELGVERQVVEQDLGEPHEMVAKGHQDGQDRSSQEPPFLFSAVHQQPEQEEEYGDCAHEHRSRRERLGAPVKRESLGYLSCVFLSSFFQQGYRGRFVRIDTLGRGSSVEVGDHQVGKFFPAI